MGGSSSTEDSFPTACQRDDPAEGSAATVDRVRRRLSLGRIESGRQENEGLSISQLNELKAELKGPISKHIRLPGSWVTVDDEDEAGAEGPATAKPEASTVDVIVLKTVTDKSLSNKPSFAEKDLSAEGADDASRLHASLAEAGCACSCRKGLKPEAPNQDGFVVVVCEGSFRLYCVLDGHGPWGHDVCQLAYDFLLKLFLRHEERDANPEKAFTEAFCDTQNILKSTTANREVDANDSGSTCTIAYVPENGNEIFVAHVGDSRAVLCRRRPGSSPRAYAAVDLTKDHKPDLKEEKERIERAGGKVVFDGFYNHRVYLRDGRGGLNMSRALGDIVAHGAGITEVPAVDKVEIRVTKVERDAGASDDVFLLVCSDGIWEFLESQEACDLVGAFPREQCKEAVEKLTEASIQKWLQDSDNEVVDDVTAVLVWL